MVLCLGLLLGACGGDGDKEPPGAVSLSREKAAEQAKKPDPATVPTPGGPSLGVIKLTVPVYEQPDPRAAKLGYLRLGAKAVRAERPAKLDACRGGYYRILPAGYVCLDDGATTDMEHPLLRAGLRAPDRTMPLPYPYAFVRAIAPRYYRLPTRKEQFEYEMSLDRHLRSFVRLGEKWNAVEVGANDVPVDRQGRVIGEAPSEAPALGQAERFGGAEGGVIPWFFAGGRKIPNVSDFKVPDYAVITNRVGRHAGLSLIDAFSGDGRQFALTTDLRLVPTSKLKPERGSTFHGVELGNGWRLPLGFVKRDEAYRYELDMRRYRRKDRLARFVPVQLTGAARGSGDDRIVEGEDGGWLKARDLAIVAKPSSLPRHAVDGVKWIDISIQRQTLVLYEGKTPVYATMVSTGRDGMDDPKSTHSTVRGLFRIRDKHVTTTMDSDVVGSKFELRDVPWVQYFMSGFALHAAYWHEDYGRPRSHGCVNMSPIDALRTFLWTDPPVPDAWHGVNAGETMGQGTIVYIEP
ncbi:MAG: L,D-transpeptidase [Deltaproteobacteria bacterium]|nr:L,D-transpeptidase [Deltaproteobacteria bacterium]